MEYPQNMKNWLTREKLENNRKIQPDLGTSPNIFQFLTQISAKNSKITKFSKVTANLQFPIDISVKVFKNSYVLALAPAGIFFGGGKQGPPREGL